MTNLALPPIYTAPPRIPSLLAMETLPFMCIEAEDTKMAVPEL